MPVRNIFKKSGRKNVIGRFPSIKVGRVVAFESLLELDFIHLLEYDQDVTWFEEQPLSIEYEFGGKLRHYVPDFRVLTRAQTQLIECKPDDLINTDENLQKFSVARIYCFQNDWVFNVVTPSEIRSGNRLRNAKFLLPYARFPVNDQTDRVVREKILNSQERLSVRDIVEQARPEDPRNVLNAIYAMLFRHSLVSVPSDTIISQSTIVSLWIPK